MAGFIRQKGKLTCDGIPLGSIAEGAGTPVYVYSRALVEENYLRFDGAFSPIPHLVCYAAKANSNLAILGHLASLGAGADVVSGGELRAALESGFPAERIVFSGVGKTDDEIRAGVREGVLALNAESERELERIDAVARELERPARVALRVNPDIDAKSHPYISTGLAHNKFGVAIGDAFEIFRRSRRLRHLAMVGVQAHIGSQIQDPEPLAETARELSTLALRLSAEGFALQTLDLGGGVGVGDETESLSPEAYAAAVLPQLAGLSLRVLIEPGRAIVARAGALVTRVIGVKESGGKVFVVTDGGMNDMIRAPLYGALHPIEPVAESRAAPTVVDVVGPVCETSDFFALDLKLPRPREGDLLAIRDAGAYGFAMASNYNFRPRPAEVLVANGSWKIVRRRETYEDLIRLENGSNDAL
ncbi:MAG TPA: diaminopimelate decarboxylase [Thermoanaerobaculia bacterium]